MAPDFKTTTAADGITGVANRLASTGLVSVKGEISSMTMGAEFALHELEMWMLGKRQRTLSISAVCEKIHAIRSSVRALQPQAEGR